MIVPRESIHITMMGILAVGRCRMRLGRFRWPHDILREGNGGTCGDSPLGAARERTGGEQAAFTERSWSIIDDQEGYWEFEDSCQTRIKGNGNDLQNSRGNEILTR
jgi:hypothetical protein